MNINYHRRGRPGPLLNQPIVFEQIISYLNKLYLRIQ